jgi:hypothetical protein
MLRGGFEPAMPTSDWPQTYAFDRAASGIGTFTFGWPEIFTSLQLSQKQVK